MNTNYSEERNVQMLISLMKVHSVRKVIASPGAMNAGFVASIQQDPYFEIYSSVDERSAGYLACGLAAESGEPVALSCTGATASRNYIPALTEAFYRKLPILAITAAHHIGCCGQNFPQIVDRTNPLNDITNMSVQIPSFHDAEDEWAYNVKLNSALLALRHRGGGPVHINLTITNSGSFKTKVLPEERVINRIGNGDVLPVIRCKKVGIFVGAHREWGSQLTNAVDSFCEMYNGVVFCDHTSNYPGKYGVMFSLVTFQSEYASTNCDVDLLIDIGDISGAYMQLKPQQTWRVHPDGVLRDTFKKLRYHFEMSEETFFTQYADLAFEKKNMTYFESCQSEYEKMVLKIPALPLSNIWCAQQLSTRLPQGCVLHLGILNSLRSWNFFKKSQDILCFANTGGFGIDGCVSSLIGASFANPDKLYFGVVGDLAFFYDMNAIGNHHVGANVRLIVVNNGRGTEFRNYNHSAAKFGEDADLYIAAAGHYGNQSPLLLKHYAQDLGFEYMCATDKDEFTQCVDKFTSPQITDCPILFEIFTDSQSESDALEMINHLDFTASVVAKKISKQIAKGILGDTGAKVIKKILNS